MKKYIYIGIGGTLGAIFRHVANGIQLDHYHRIVPMDVPPNVPLNVPLNVPPNAPLSIALNVPLHFPLNTLLINIAGSFMLALLLTIAYEARVFDENLRLGIAVGLLGSFTTFSSLCKEIAGLIYHREYFTAITYMVDSTILGLIAAYLGMVIAREIFSKLAIKELIIIKRKKFNFETNTIEETEREVE